MGPGAGLDGGGPMLVGPLGGGGAMLPGFLGAGGPITVGAYGAGLSGTFIHQLNLSLAHKQEEVD